MPVWIRRTTSADMIIPSRIVIEIISHAGQRYETVGDYFLREGLDGQQELLIRVSEMSDWRHQALVAIHELAEIYLCAHAGVEIGAIDKFDMDFEEKRPEGNFDEPGDAVDSPYRDQHCTATAIERLMCAQFGLPWKQYEDEVNSLYQ